MPPESPVSHQDKGLRVFPQSLPIGSGRGPLLRSSLILHQDTSGATDQLDLVTLGVVQVHGARRNDRMLATPKLVTKPL